MSLSTTTPNVYSYADCHYAACCLCRVPYMLIIAVFIALMSGVLQRVVMLNVVAPQSKTLLRSSILPFAMLPGEQQQKLLEPSFQL
jgi:hypothetical protein